MSLGYERVPFTRERVSLACFCLEREDWPKLERCIRKKHFYRCIYIYIYIYNVFLQRHVELQRQRNICVKNERQAYVIYPNERQDIYYMCENERHIKIHTPFEGPIASLGHIKRD